MLLKQNSTPHLIQVALDLCIGFMQGVHRCATKLKLATRLDSYTLAIELCANDVVSLHDGLPAVTLTQPFQQSSNLRVFQPPLGGLVVAQLLVLSSNPARKALFGQRV